MKITDVKCTLIADWPVVRITTDEGIDGIAQGDVYRPYLKWQVLFDRDQIIGEDPTDVERVMDKIRRAGAFKPWGVPVSMIEVALWDIAGKAAGVPAYKLLGGKVRDRVRVYNGNVRFPLVGNTPKHHAERMLKMKESKEGFTIIKDGIAFHGPMADSTPGQYFGDPPRGRFASQGGLFTREGFKHTMACIEAMKDVLGDDVGLALDCGPGFTVIDAIKLAKACEPLDLMWLEDMVTGDYTPYVLAQLYRDVTTSTSTPIHTGEQIYLRQNFKDLIEMQAVRVVGPDPMAVGGIAELKWIAEYADLHGIMMAPHGTLDGLIGLAALVQVSATLPRNFIAFEYPTGNPPWWYDIVDGLPDPIVKNGFIDVEAWDKPGLGVKFNVKAAQKHLPDGDKDFFS